MDCYRARLTGEGRIILIRLLFALSKGLELFKGCGFGVLLFGGLLRLFQRALGLVMSRQLVMDGEHRPEQRTSSARLLLLK